MPFFYFLFPIKKHLFIYINLLLHLAILKNLLYHTKLNYMSIKNLLEEFEKNKSLSSAAIDYIQNNEEIGGKLVYHFRKNKNRDFAINFIEKLTEIRNRPYPDGYEASTESLCYLVIYSRFTSKY